MQENEIVNRVANSALVTLDLEDYVQDIPKVGLDIADFLFQRILLREKDFRQFIKDHDWSQYQDKAVHVFCGEDAIIPVWAYMLIVTKLETATSIYTLGSTVDLDRQIIDISLAQIDLTQFADGKVVIKGCSDLPMRDYAYFKVTQMLTPIVTSLMYGEPCSTVPVFKKKK